MIHRSPLRAWMFGMAGACVLTTAQAHQTSSAQAPDAAPAGAEAQALRAVRDKATGKLRAPTADELRAMEAQERAARRARGLPEVEAPTPLVVRQHASGMRSVKLGPEHMMTLRGERQPDGSIRRFHPDGTTHDHAPVARDNRPTE